MGGGRGSTGVGEGQREYRGRGGAEGVYRWRGAEGVGRGKGSHITP